MNKNEIAEGICELVRTNTEDGSIELQDLQMILDLITLILSRPHAPTDQPDRV